MQSLQGSVVQNLSRPSFKGRFHRADTPYFEVTQRRKGYYQRLHFLQEYALGHLGFTAFKIWDWMERTLSRQLHYRPEQPAVLAGVSAAEITERLNHWASESNHLCSRTIERALQELVREGFLEIRHRYRRTATGQRQQLPSEYRLLCPAGARFLLDTKAPRFEEAETKTGPSRPSQPDKTGPKPPSKMSESKKIISKKEKGLLASTQMTDAPPPAASSPPADPYFRSQPWQEVFQHFLHTAGYPLREALRLMLDVEALWGAGTTGVVGGLLIEEGGWRLLN